MKEIEQLKSELKTENERNEKLRKFNESSDKVDKQLKAQRRTKDTTSLGYPGLGPMETGESSKPKRVKDDKRNQSEARGMKYFKFTCNHYGKLGHKTKTVGINRLIKRRLLILMVTITIVISMVTLLMSVDLNQAACQVQKDLMDISSIVISLDIDQKNVDLRQRYQGHSLNQLVLTKRVIS